MMFVSTRVSDYVMECLQNNRCVTLTAPSGVGKSFIARHTALLLKKEGYRIIPVYTPTDIRTYYLPGKQTIFIIDDICGNYTANQQQIDNWVQLLPLINKIVADKCCKIIVCCRLQVYKDDKFDILLPFKSCECNLISDKLGLMSVEKTAIAKTYIGTGMTYIDDESFKLDCFPLLCSLCHEKEDVDVIEFFRNPFAVYNDELDKLREHGDEGNLKMCGLALCVIFDNQLVETWFEGKATDEQLQIIKDICEAYELSGIPKAKLKKPLDTLDGTFICKQDGIYRTVHDKLFDFLAHYFGHEMLKCFIYHSDSNLVHGRFIWQTSVHDKTSEIDFSIEIPDDYLESYLERLTKDWLAGKVTVVFSNKNMKVSSFRQKLLQYLQQLDKSQQVTLASIKDTLRPKEDCGSGSTPLILTCYDGYTDMVQWMLHNDVDVDQCRDDGATGLFMASQAGHTDILKLLLERNPKVDLWNNNGCSPLYMASQNGHTDIVKLLLEKNPNVDICNNDGCSPLLMASQNGNTDIVKLLLMKGSYVELCDKNGCSPLLMASESGNTNIVKLLLERDPNVDSCNNDGFTPLISACISNCTSIVKLLIKHKSQIHAQTNDGRSALFYSTLNGNLEITMLLLENDADCNICAYSKPIITDIFTNHQSKILDKEKQDLIDRLIKSTPSHVKDYVSKRSLDDAFDVIDGSSPLHIACFKGRIDIVRCLLNHKADINMTKKDGTTPLYFACEVGHHDIVSLLLDKGADTQICRLDRKSPLCIAKDNGHTSIVIILTNPTKKEAKLSS